MSPRVFSDSDRDEVSSRYVAGLESALLAQALAETGSQSDERTRALLQLWLMGTFNANALPVEGLGGIKGELRWENDHTGFRLTWLMPSGIACPLARIYPQENDTFVALIVAGGKDELIEAMAAAEWGIGRLTG